MMSFMQKIACLGIVVGYAMACSASGNQKQSARQIDEQRDNNSAYVSRKLAERDARQAQKKQQAAAYVLSLQTLKKLMADCQAKKEMGFTDIELSPDGDL